MPSTSDRIPSWYTMDTNPFTPLLEQSLSRRKDLLERLPHSGDGLLSPLPRHRRGQAGPERGPLRPLVLAQTFREPLSPGETVSLEDCLRGLLPFSPLFAYNHRGAGTRRSFEPWHPARPGGARRARVPGSRPALPHPGAPSRPRPLALPRPARRTQGFAQKSARGKSVLNLFAYTCSAGVCAAAARKPPRSGTRTSPPRALPWAKKAARLNRIAEERFRLIEEDCLRSCANWPA